MKVADTPVLACGSILGCFQIYPPHVMAMLHYHYFGILLLLHVPHQLVLFHHFLNVMTQRQIRNYRNRYLTVVSTLECFPLNWYEMAISKSRLFRGLGLHSK